MRFRISNSQLLTAFLGPFRPSPDRMSSLLITSFLAMTPIYKDGNYNLNPQKLYFLELYSGAADLCLVSWRAIKPTTVPDYGLVLANKAGQLSPTTAKQCYNVHKHASNTVNNSNTVTVTVTQPSYAVTGQWIKHRLRSFSRFVLSSSPECQFYILHQKHLQFQTQHDRSQNNLAFLGRKQLPLCTSHRNC